MNEGMLFERPTAAKYKIEVHFGKVRRQAQAVGLVSIFESGGTLEGEGDVKIYWCPGDSCGKPMFHSSHASGVPFCEHCKQTWKGSELVGERFFRMSIADVAQLVEKTFRQLGGDADIYIHYHPTDLRHAMLAFREEDLEVQLGQARAGRQRPYVYTLARIIKDTSAGADLLKRIRAFLEA